MVVLTSEWPSNSCTVRMSVQELQQMRGNAVAQGVYRHGLDDTRQRHSQLQSALQPLFKQVAPTLNAATRVN